MRRLLRQAAGVLAQMHATEALLESRKFDAFNKMSAFVVHDLKNIITQLSLMMKNAERPMLEFVLKLAGGNQTAAAEMLGINRNTLRRKLLEHKLIK